MGKTNFKYQLTGFAIVGCLSAIYISYMYLKRTNKEYVSTYFEIYDTMFLIIGVGSRTSEKLLESESDFFFNPTPQSCCLYMKPENYTHYEVDESCKELDKLLQRELIQAKVEIKQP